MSVGNFSQDRKSFIISDMRPRRPLINYLWNENSVIKCDHFGFGNSFACIGAIRRTMDEGERLVFIKDKTCGVTYSPNRNYDDLKFDNYNATVGLGYHKVSACYKGLSTDFTMTTPTTGYNILFRITIKNISDEVKSLSTYFVNRPQPNLTWHTSYGIGDYNKDLGGIVYSHEGFDLPHDYVYLFLKPSIQPTAFDVIQSAFTGVYGTFSHPQSLKNDKLSCKGTTFEDNYVGALQFDLQLNPGEEKTIDLVFGSARNLDECIEISNKYINAFDSVLLDQKALNDSYLNTFTCNTCDDYYNTMANVWLKRQLSLGKTWGRICGKGFRDVMQDITAFVSLDPPLARTRILDALSHQYEDGNPIRMYEPDFLYPYNDGAVWIPSAVLGYLKESGNFAILDEVVPYLYGDSYSNSTTGEAYIEKHNTSRMSGTVLEHVEKGIDYLLGCTGKRGLVLFRGGDWNDSLNNAGNLGKGESVWLSIATVKAINELNEILTQIGQTDKVKDYTAKRDVLIANILKYGYENDYFIYGYNDYDEKIGSASCAEGKIFLNPQSFSIISGIMKGDDAKHLINIVKDNLKCDFGYLQCTPSFTKGSDKLGRMSYFVPGMVENGSVYNHGVTFLIAALCGLGDGNSAYEAFKMIRFDNPKNANSGVEPYAVSNMYIGPENPYRVGEAPMSWVTGTAGWLYRDLTEFILGIQAQFNGLKVIPSVPDDWDNITVSRRYRDTIYSIKMIKQDDKKGLYVDDKKMEDNIIPIGTSEKAKIVYYL